MIKELLIFIRDSYKHSDSRYDMKIDIFKFIPAAFNAIQKGKRLNNVVAWKNVQLIANALAAVVVLLKLFGIDFGFSESDIDVISGAIVVIVNAYLTLATTNKVGIPQKLPPIELQGRVEPLPFDDPTFRGMHDNTNEVQPSSDHSTPPSCEYTPRSGWNG